VLYLYIVRDVTVTNVQYLCYHTADADHAPYN